MQPMQPHAALSPSGLYPEGGATYQTCHGCTALPSEVRSCCNICSRQIYGKGGGEVAHERHLLYHQSQRPFSQTWVQAIKCIGVPAPSYP